MQPITWYTMFLACAGTRRAAIIPTLTSQAKVLNALEPLLVSPTLGFGSSRWSASAKTWKYR